jgi:hypothetical protein
MGRWWRSWRHLWFVLAFAIGAILARPGEASADVIPQGQKGVNYCATVSNVGDFPDYVVFAYEQPQNPSVPGSFYTLADATCQSLRFPTTYYAMKRADFSRELLPADRNAQRSFLEGDSRVIRGLAISPTRFVDQRDSTTSIAATYRIESITESGLAMQLVGQSPAPGSASTLGGALTVGNRAVAFAWFALVPLAALIAIGVVLLVRRRRRAA